MARAQSVTRLRPRTRSFSQATEAYSSGFFDVCLSSLDPEHSAASAALAARALLRLGRASEALELIEFLLSGKTSFSHVEMGELLTHLASARARLGQATSGIDLAFADARVYVYAAASAALEAEFLSHVARAHLMAGAVDLAEEHARNVLEVKSYLLEPSYSVPLEHSRARAYDILAFIAARRERYDEQKRCTRAALEECDRTPVRDTVFEANLLSNLAIFALDFGDDGYVRERLDRLPESDVITAQRYEVLRALGWANALRGNNLGAFRDLRDAGEVAPTLPRRIRATLDRAYFARQLNQEISAREELDFAERLSTRVDWKDVATDEGELIALLQLGQQIAPVAPLRARRLFERYKSLKPKLPPDLLATCDRRARAEELVADATISHAEGNADRATALFLEAFEIWDTLGYGVRAALVARELATLGTGTRFAEYVAREAALRPRSWFAASLR